MTTFSYPQVQFLIDGVWRRGARGLTLPVLDSEGKLTGVITSDDVISLLRAKL